ncbi:MAG: DUF4124 domain-containing protein [Nitrospinales bacterium]
MVGALALFFLATLFERWVPAAVYKWRDERGSVHFTDDINQVPKRYRKPPYLLKVPRTSDKPPFSSPVQSSPGAASKEISEHEDAGPGTSKAEETRLTEEEKTAIREAISYLEGEIQRDEILTRMMPSERNGKTFVAAIKRSLPQKKGLAEKLSKLEPPLIKKTLGFIKASIDKDEQVRVTGPKMKRRTLGMLNRLKREMETKVSLVGELKELLKMEEDQTEP